ncbi:MAG TPA: transposase, partial [Candidatus Limnocylindria bacterium]|nr:transposase [Candidatus Limnocylindria bacterium]
PKELALHGITGMEQANRYLQQVYLPAHNAEFRQPPLEEGAAFVECVVPNLDDILCEQHERVVGRDNCVSFEGRKLQIPPDRHRCHYIKATVRVHRFLDDTLAVFHGPRILACYAPDGIPISQKVEAIA